MLEQLVVGTIVVVAFWYAVWVLMPSGLRASLARRVTAWGRAPGRAAWLAGAAASLGRVIGARSGG
ncbi:MAG TPA: hypothetical protein VF277_06360, partial [Steroidobacteraceae bacterium]